MRTERSRFPNPNMSWIPALCEKFGLLWFIMYEWTIPVHLRSVFLLKNAFCGLASELLRTLSHHSLSVLGRRRGSSVNSLPTPFVCSNRLSEPYNRTGLAAALCALRRHHLHYKYLIRVMLIELSAFKRTFHPMYDPQVRWNYPIKQNYLLHANLPSSRI